MKKFLVIVVLGLFLSGCSSTTTTRNIEINKLDMNVNALNVALTSLNKISFLKMGDTSLGGALNSFDVAVRENGDNFKTNFNQASIGFTVDKFISFFD